MTTRMLIDARHREETRVAVVKGNRIDEFDFESAERKQLKGNIYLAKVTRVEPSLQAAFVDYGGNRHGFLAFSEIHPDYYQIPKEDREALLREEAEHAAEEAALRADFDDEDDDDFDGDEDDAADGEVLDVDADEDDLDDAQDGDDDAAAVDGEGVTAGGGRRGKRRGGSDEDVEALRERRQNLRRRYKIQDVIRRRQVLLVQVVKEERGNKGAALTTYLSLAGRYCVLMPNTSHGGGISRKISNAGDRKRLKAIMADMKLPPSMGCIVRTAGLQRTQTEIRRDFDYLARLWDGIRDATLESSAPALVYGDSDLIKRAIRDIYNREIDEVIVEGESGFRQAKDFMRLLSPSHARKVKQYADAVPLFQRAGVEDQLAAMYHPVVQLKSGGYLVINPTEALVSIDINSGRSTREHNIEQTATATNLEAAAEIARQLRLRDMAGLVVIDFIDMDHSSNVRKVEKAVKDALKNDRARIQVGRISSFGLMEMSRQRLRTGVLEASTRQCPHCEGTGLVRTAPSAGLSALRLVEDEAARGRGSLLTLRTSHEAAFYVLNRKRGDIAEIEDRYGVQVEILPDGEQEGARMSVEASGPPPAYAPRVEALVVVEDDDDLPEDIEDEIEVEEEPEAAEPRARRSEPRDDDEGGDNGRRRRRRRGRRGRNRPEDGGPEEGAPDEGGDTGEDEFDGTTGDREPGEPAGIDAEDEPSTDSDDGETAFVGEQPVGDTGDGRRRRGRRGRRGGGRRQDADRDSERGEASEVEAETEADGGNAPSTEIGSTDAGEAVNTVEPELALTSDAPTGTADASADAPVATDAGVDSDVASIEEAEIAAPRGRRRPRARAAAETAAPPVAQAAEPASDAGPDSGEETPKPRRARRRKADAAETTGEQPVVSAPATAAAPEPDAAVEEAPKPRRRSRRKPAGETDVAAENGAEGTAALADTPAAPSAAAPPVTAAEPAPPANGDASGVDTESGDGEPDVAGDQPTPRRGWWQRTFGA